MYLGAAWCECAGHAKQDSLLSLENVCQLHVIVWSTFLQFNLGERASNLRETRVKPESAIVQRQAVLAGEVLSACGV